MNEEPEKLTELCTTLGITIECTPGAKGEPISDHDMDGWRVTLHFAGRTHETDFWQGTGCGEYYDRLVNAEH